MKTVKFYTLGCKVNQYETQALIEDFQANGFKQAEDNADLCVINTCTVTARADAKCREMINKARRENPQARIAAVGCLVTFNGASLQARKVEYIVPQDRKHELVDIVTQRSARPGRNRWSLNISRFCNSRAFVKVQDGCDNFCSYCKIPYLRGAPASRPEQDIVAEIERISPDHPEIVLCGTNIGLYGRESGYRNNLASLLEKLLGVKKLGRLRISSISPLHVSDRLLALFKDRKLCPHLHLPFQCGDDIILKKMNKKSTTGLYKEVVDKARAIIPEIAVSCDILAGFPGEDDSSFRKTCDFLAGIRPMRLHVFSFSPREKTCFEGMVLNDAAAVRERTAFLKSEGRKWAQQYVLSFRGKPLAMVSEEKTDRGVIGYTENYLRVCLPDPGISPGEVVKVTVNKVEKGKIIAERFAI